MKKQTNTDLRRKLREQRAAYEELLGLSGAILAALCVRCGDGATLRLPWASAWSRTSAWCDVCCSSKGLSLNGLIGFVQRKLDHEG